MYSKCKYWQPKPQSVEYFIFENSVVPSTSDREKNIKQGLKNKSVNPEKRFINNWFPFCNFNTHKMFLKYLVLQSEEGSCENTYACAG